MRTPPFLRVLKGTTVRRAFELAQVHLVATNTNGAAGTSLLQGIDQGREIASVELLQAREVFLLAGDTHGYAVTSIDGHQVLFDSMRLSTQLALNGLGMYESLDSVLT